MTKNEIPVLNISSATISQNKASIKNVSAGTMKIKKMLNVCKKRKNPVDSLWQREYKIKPLLHICVYTLQL